MKFRNSRSEALIQPFHFQKDSRVQEQFGYDCDINNIVRGMTAPMPMRTPVLTDEVKVFSPDMYEQAMYKTAEAKSLFMQLPSDIRKQFDNDPKKMLEFVSNPENKEACIELGLMTVNENAARIARQESILGDIASSLKSEKAVETVTLQGSSGG